MADGRHFTDYRPRCQVEQIVHAANPTFNSFQQRHVLTNNATVLMEQNRSEACAQNCCGPCVAPYQSGTMRPPASRGGGNGVPTHSDEPLACPGWNDSVTPPQRDNCCTPTASAAKYYPESDAATTSARLSVPSGGIPLA